MMLWLTFKDRVLLIKRKLIVANCSEQAIQTNSKPTKQVAQNLKQKIFEKIFEATSAQEHLTYTPVPKAVIFIATPMKKRFSSTFYHWVVSLYI